jgi:hypothetical protein
MNASQLRTVATVVSKKIKIGFTRQEPPGCGKTHTVVGMIAATGERMIVTAPSNAAVANIALKLFKSGQWRQLP